MKKIIIAIIFTLITNYSFSQEYGCFNFTMNGATVDGRYIPNVTLNIPVSIDALPYEFTMQLDLGAVNTTLYGNSIQPYMVKYPSLKNKIDSTKTFVIQNKKNIKLSGVNLKMGDVQFKTIDIGLFANYGDVYTVDSLQTKSSKHIGTIGPDLFQDKVLVIDYPNKKICIYKELPNAYSKSNFDNFKMQYGRILIPFDIDGNKEMLMFDTGSSMFSLLTVRNNAKLISDGKIVDSLSVNSWGNLMAVYSSKVNTDVKFAGIKLPETNVHFLDNAQFENGFKQLGIWGITGNAYFTNNTVIIDYKNQMFGVQ